MYPCAPLNCCLFSGMDCPQLDSNHATLNSSITNIGYYVSISCDSGYRINGKLANTVHCTNSAEWSDKHLTCLGTFQKGDAEL